MKKDRRRFITDLAVHYGIEALVFDPEPHRHVLAVTSRGKAQFPGGGSKQHYMSLTAQLQHEFVGSVKVVGVSSQQMRPSSRLQQTVIRPAPPPPPPQTVASSSDSVWTGEMTFSTAAIHLPTDEVQLKSNIEKT